MSIKFKPILEEIVTSHRTILNDKLVGLYLHGSTALGCATDNSDIDYIVVVNEKLTFTEKEKIMTHLVELSEQAPKKGLEMSIIMEDAVKPFIYPTPFELHASACYIEKFKQTRELCTNSVDYDTAAHVTVLLERGICLFGRPIENVFSKVPVEHFKDSIFRDIQDARKQFLDEPVYCLLNLSRVWMYFEEGDIASKLEGGEWAITKLPTPYKEVIKSAVHSYQNGTTFSISKDVKETVNILFKNIRNL